MEKDFFEQVYQVARLIPVGRVTSYGAIARCLGVGRAARMVGWAMSASHGSEGGGEGPQTAVPAHRVLNRTGLLSGKHHFGSPTRMQELLEAEGIRVENDRVVDFKTLFWDPNIELFAP